MRAHTLPSSLLDPSLGASHTRYNVLYIGLLHQHPTILVLQSHLLFHHSNTRMQTLVSIHLQDSTTTMLRLRSLIATVVLFSSGLAIAAASGDAHSAPTIPLPLDSLTIAVSVALSNISALSNSTSHAVSPYHAPAPGTVTNYTAYDENEHPQNTNYNVPLSDLVQVSDSRWPEEEKMKAMKWQGWATVEVNLFSDVINTCGNLTGPLIYGAVWQTLNDQCPTKIGNNHSPPCWGGSTPLAIRRKSNDGGWEGKYFLLGSFAYTDCAFQNLSANSGSSAPTSEMQQLVRRCSGHSPPRTKHRRPTT